MIKDHDWVNLLLGGAHEAVLRREGMSEADVQTSMDLFWFDEDLPRTAEHVEPQLDPGQHWFTDEEGRYGLPCKGPGCFVCKLLREQEGR